MANLPKITATPKRIRIVVMLVVFLLASLVLVFNTGLRNAFYQATWIVRLPASATEEYVNSFSSAQYLAALDKENKELHWQGIPTDELNRKVEEIKAQFPNESVTVSEINELLPPALATRVAYGAVFVMVVSVVFLYLNEVGKFAMRKLFLKVSLLNLIATLWSIIVMLGILSSMSLIYKLTVYSFLSLVILLMWAGMGYYLSLSSFDKDLTLNFALENQRSFWRKFNRANWVWLIVLVILMSIGLGTVFVVDGILIAIAVVVSGYAQQELPILIPSIVKKVLSIRFYRPTPRVKKSQVLKPVTQTASMPKSSKVKDSKKKNKKSKRK